jgi:hypothetical protein
MIPMKIHRFLLAFSCAFLLLASYAFAGDKDPCKDKDTSKDQAACTCPKDKDGKVCGTDKDCCCTGAKACKDGQKNQKQDVKKDDAKTDDAKKP